MEENHAHSFRYILLHGIKDGVCTCSLGVACKSAGKHPIQSNWQNQTMNGHEIEQRPDDTNIGTLTGPESNLVVVDIDPRHGGDESLKKLITTHGELPATPTVQTGGGGQHYYFAYPMGMNIRNRTNVWPGIDIRAIGGFVVAPPSKHVSGSFYRWQDGLSPEDVPIAEMPIWLLTALQTDSNSSQTSNQLPEIIPEGSRNVSLTSLAGSMRRRGASQEAILAAIREENNRCSCPLDDADLVKIAASVSKYEPAPVTIEWNEETKQDLLNQIQAMDDFTKLYVPEMVELLCLANRNDPAAFATIKMKLRGKTNFKDLERVIRIRDQEIRESAQATSRYLHLPGLVGNGFLQPNCWKVDMKDGVVSIGSKQFGGEQIACFVPVVETKRLRNIDSGMEKVELSFFRDNHWKTTLAPRSTVFNRNSILKISDSGLPVTSNNAGDLISYLTDFEYMNQAEIPIIGSVSRLGWLKDGGFFPFSNPNQYEFETDSKEAALILNSLTANGTEDQWIETANEARSSPVARFIIAASFASVLIEPLHKRVFFIHTWHNSRSGKTATLKLALAAWGDPLKLLGSFNSTIVGLERLASALRNLPFAIDELQVLNTKRMSADNIIYMLSQGQGRTRGGKDGGLQENAIWRNIILTTGEEAMLGSSTQDGAGSRTFEIYAQPVQDIALAARMHEVSEKHFGHAGKIFIEKLTMMMSENHEMLSDLYDKIKGRLQFSYPNNIHIDEVAIVCLGDYLSSIYVFGEQSDEAIRKSVETALEMLEQNNQLTQDDNIERAWDFITGWLIANYNRFNTLASPPIFGKIDECGNHLIIPSYANNALKEEGFSPKKVIRGFAERGYIQTQIEPDGTKRLQMLRRIDGKPCRVYVLNLQGKVQEEDMSFLS